MLMNPVIALFVACECNREDARSVLLIASPASEQTTRTSTRSSTSTWCRCEWRAVVCTFRRLLDLVLQASPLPTTRSTARHLFIQLARRDSRPLLHRSRNRLPLGRCRRRQPCRSHLQVLLQALQRRWEARVSLGAHSGESTLAG